MNVQSYWTPQKGKVNNKQNEIKQEFLFLKDPPLNLREGWVKIWSFEPTSNQNLYSPHYSAILRVYDLTSERRNILFGFPSSSDNSENICSFFCCVRVDLRKKFKLRVKSVTETFFFFCLPNPTTYETVQFVCYSVLRFAVLQTSL